jgi:hypothetical protein
MGTYGLNADNTGVVINVPVINNDGQFDTYETFNEETYQVNKKAFVAVQGMATNGEYTPLPNVQLVAYDISLEFLVYIDNPISEVIRMAIEEIRDSFIGNMDILEIEEVDLDDEDVDASTITDYLKITTTADSLDFGEIFTISKKRYLNYTLTVTLTVSKNVEMGNQFEWEIQQLAQNAWVLSDVTYWNANGVVGGRYDLPIYGSPDPTRFDEAWKVVSGTAGRIAYTQLVMVETSCSGGEPDCMSCPPSSTSQPVCKCVDFETICYVRQNVTLYAYYKVQESAYNGSYETVIPLVASWGTTQDMESFQTLRSLNPITVSKAKQVHNYVKSRGYGLSMTFLFDSSSPIIRRLFKDSFEEVETPPIYNIRMKFKEVDANGNYTYPNDLTFTKRVTFGESQPSEISYGEPIVLGVGFVISAK